MSESNGTPEKPDLAALRKEIRETRAELGQTVQALAARADVKARAREQVEQTKQRVLDQAAVATGRVRAAAAQAGASVRGTAGQATERLREAAPGELAHEATARVRATPVPAALVFAGLAAVVGVILIMRGRR
ncbi:DUF3618 domain-containing protein [Actinoplanes teichomyceticus]|uniref:Uncharacterized protein DUF3618 n=1 Tax=Actinoplanes teichomyceticus TaxID=1867 RepID=A0A561VRK1_ACTTI|nr:DUF3618 domain-containing protein [Actinoplanes teichomyceticus]TWG14247.1 uncharacterized protein DUF3618 [Actinoplanes teichomyceticus]GIF13197.1 hypothetical protein Ate01nite_32290 [Actinoplanes teichomyceticus]